MEFDFPEPSLSRIERQPMSRVGNSSGPQYLCPDSSQTISRAVHLARLNAAWSVCDQCEHRHDTEGLAERTVQDTERIRDLRSNGIRRTEFGIRGQYINELDRRTTSEIAKIFCLCLNQTASETEAGSLHDERDTMSHGLSVNTALRSDVSSSGGFRSSASEQQPAMLPLSPVVAGYDGRSSSPDIFVGLTAAIRECGLPVFDIGRCTAASIQEAVRSLPDCAGAMFVTGAGAPASWTGLDVSDPAGDPVPVVWKEYGVRLQHVGPASYESERPNQESRPLTSRVVASAVGERSGTGLNTGVPSSDDGLDQLLHRMRAETDRPRLSEPARQMSLRLLLPDSAHRNRWMRRLTRHSGRHEVIDFEARYRHWLSRWFSETQSIRILVRTDDPVIQQRVTWLAETTGMELIARSVLDPCVIPSLQLTMTIEEDDRQFLIQNSAGHVLSAERLAVLINTAVHSQFSQVTAHSDLASGRFWMTDKGRSATNRITEHIRDSLATLGLVSRLMQLGRLSLDE